MKIWQTLSMALPALLGIGSSFVMHQKKAFFSGATYYGIATGGGQFFWTKTDPTIFGYACVSSPTGYCTIVTRGGALPYSPQADVESGSNQALPTSPQHGLYQ